MSYSLQPHGLQHAKLPCPSLTPRTCSNSCLWNWWCHITISSSVVPFSICLQSFPAPGSLLRSQFFTSGGQSFGASALGSVLLMNIQDISFRIKTTYPPEMLRGLKQNLVHTRTQRPHRDWAWPDFECLSVSCGGAGQQWPATEKGCLAATDLGGTSCDVSPPGGDHH